MIINGWKIILMEVRMNEEISLEKRRGWNGRNHLETIPVLKTRSALTK